MPVFYTGKRPVLKGRNANENVNPYTGKVGVYSNWSIFNPSNVLDGAPNVNHVPGEGRFPHALQMTRRYLGIDTQAPLDTPGLGPELEWHNKVVTQYSLKGQDGQDVFPDEFGHLDRKTSYSLREVFKFNGITPEPLKDPGHTYRVFGDPGIANWFGPRQPWMNKGVTEQPLEDAGLSLDDKPKGLEYGFPKQNEWKGVPSSKAL